MKIIEIEENQKENWNQFVVLNSSESFLQSWQWGDFQQKTGKKIFRIGVVDKDELMVVAFLIKHNLPLGRSYLYCPRGPVLKLELQNQESEISDLLFSEIRKLAEKEKSLFLRIDPPVESNHKYFNNFKKSFVEIQPKDTLILSLEKADKELLKEMKSKTRYNIRLAEKKGVLIRSCKLGITNPEEFQKKFDFFWDLTEETSERNKIVSHNKDYYQKMLDSLNSCNKFDDKKDLYARLYLAEFEGKTIAANIVLCFGDLVIYLHGASSNKYRNLMAPYLLQWQQIQDAKNVGYKKYDFWGITIDGEKETWQGITKFKKGFGGNEKRYVGAYDLVFDKLGYSVYQVLKKIRNLRK
ncbi:MAG: peptidoglycan bridge formation glycyltransferase FemA/FemB family protein [Candidatus Pacebacteria bacterium]|nr:peptidoglycan bridge formation glycyltransferase FemA/FemB family protein [Candidatus Paceibacterota bacterium]